METVEEFRQRARAWIQEHLETAEQAANADRSEDETWSHARGVQRRLYDEGFAGLCFPQEYGGGGRSREYQEAFNEESTGFDVPRLLNIPNLGICAPTILDAGTEEQKRTHISAILRGDEVVVQFLSEPSGGSDLAAVRTRAVRDGDGWKISGAKIWTSFAHQADYALCLARTDWDVPKHEGLTMFFVKIRQPGVTVKRILRVNGNAEFCEEFLDEVAVPADAVLGEVNGGWRVASKMLRNERTAIGGGSKYTSGIGWPSASRRPSHDFVSVARTAGVADRDWARQLVASSHIQHLVHEALAFSVSERVASGDLPDAALAIIRLASAETDWLDADVGLDLAGAAAVSDSGNQLFEYPQYFLSRQATSLGGGTTEMSRNIISERLLGMPREVTPDRGVPFSQVAAGR